MKLTGNKIGFALLAAAYLVAVFLVTRRSVEEVASDRVTIRISQWQLEGGVREAMDAIIARYEQLNPKVHVVQLAVPGGSTYLPWIMTQMIGETGPDLAEYSWPWPDTARNFEPITAEVMQPNPYNRGTPLEHVPWRDTFIDGMTSPDNYVQTLSQYYGVSMTTGLHRIVYNRALVKTITGSDAAPRTYREFMALCAKIQAYAEANHLQLSPLANSRINHFNLSTEIVNNLAMRVSERIDFQHRLKIEAPDLATTYLRGEWSYEDPEIAAGFAALREVGAICTPGFVQRERDTALTDFVSGRAAMVVAPSWESTSLTQLCPFAIGAFRFPSPREDDPVYGRFARGPFSEGQIMTGMPFYLNRRTAHRAEALDFLKFLGSQEGSTIFTRVSDWLPVVMGVQPSAFAAQFQLQTEGYNWYGGFLGPSGHITSQNFVVSRFYNLWNSDGTVEKFSRALRGVSVPIREDLGQDAVSGLENIRREDTAAVARAELAAPGHRPETLQLVTLPNEYSLYQVRAVLALPLPAVKP
jgi:raffinose/stachyose/melibiose transport system substrate-binding protein